MTLTRHSILVHLTWLFLLIKLTVTLCATDFLLILRFFTSQSDLFQWDMCSNLCKIFVFIQRYYSSLKSSDVLR